MTPPADRHALGRDLQAFVDGELPPERHAALAAAMADDPGLAAEAARLIGERQTFDRLAETLLSQPVPRRLIAAAAEPPEGARFAVRRRRLGYAAASLVAAVTAIALIVSWHRQGAGWWRVPGEPVVTAALEARDGRLRLVREIVFRHGGADDGAAAPTGADRFLSAGLREQATVPDLRRAGFVLSAAELYDGDTGRAVQLRYVDRHDELFTVYIHPGAGPDRFRLLSAHRLRVCLWQNEDVATVMSGELPQPELFRLASMAYTALSL